MINLRLEPVSSDKFGGFLLAFVIGVTAVSASLPIGLLLALGRRSDMPFIKGIAVTFIEFIRGVPLITMLFTASLLLNYFLPPQSNFDLILRVIILVTVFAAAYIAEVIRGGLAALPKGQSEAADALGLDYWQAQRFIILPQALKISIPGIVSTFIGLFKDTTLVALVGLADPLQGITKIVRADINWKGVYWEPFLFVGVIFFVFCFGMSRYSMYLENKLKTDHR
jgi:general L-amino acid transport system permease protein